MAKKETKPRKIMIIPRSDDVMAERFAIANGKRLPFETPVTVSDDDIKALKNQKVPYQDIQL